MKGNIRTYWPAYCIIFAWLIFCSPYFIKGFPPFPSKYLVTFFPPWNASYAMPVKNNALSDVITQIYPWKYFSVETWKSGVVPLWNPYSFSGTSHAANYQSAVYTPMNLLFFILPFDHAWSILVLFQPLLAGLSMYLLIRSLKLSKYASLFGSLSFMFCGFVTVWMAYGTLAYAIGFLPLILFGIRRYAADQKWFWGVVLSLSVQNSFLSGHFQISLYVLIASFMFAFLEFFKNKNKALLLQILMYLTVGVALSAPQLLQSYEAFKGSVRMESFGSMEVIPWHYLITLLAPDFYGNPVTRNDWFGHYAEWSGYIGVLPLALALFGLWRKKSRTELFFWLLALATLLLATPSPLNALLYIARIPVLSSSAASRIIVLFSFSLSILSAYGVDHLRRYWQEPRGVIITRHAILLLTLLAFIWLDTLVNPFLKVHASIAARNFILPSMYVLLFITGSYLGKKMQIHTPVLLLFLVAATAELLRFSIKWMPFEPQEYIYPQTPLITELQKSGNNRVFGNFGNELAVRFRIQSLEGYDSVYQKRYGEFISSAGNGKINTLERSIAPLDKYGIGSEKILQLLGVRYVLSKISDGQNVWAYPVWQYPNYNRIYRDEHYELFENRSTYPRAFLTNSYKVIQGDQDILDALYSEGIDLKNEVILEHEPLVKPEPGKGDLSLVKYLPNAVVFESMSDSSKLLFLSDAYDSGWRALVNNVQSPVYRADYAFRAVALPPGSNKVVLYYLPDAFYVGLWISAVALVILAGFCIKDGYARRFL